LPISEKVFFLVLIINITFTVIFNFKNLSPFKSYEIHTSRYNSFLKINKFTIIINIIGLALLLLFLNFQLTDFLTLKSFAIKANQISSLRYSKGLELPIANRIINAIVYFVLAYNGFYFSKNKDKIHLINLLLIACQTVLINTKATMTFGLAFWIGGFLTGIKYFGIRIKFKNIVKFVIISLLIFNFFVLINYTRHNMNFTYREEVKKIISENFVAPFSAYNLWFESKRKSEMQYGLNSFEGIFRIFSSISHVHGEMIFINGIHTNVYTVFKHLNSDFGTIGAIIFIGIISILGNYSDRKISAYSMKGVAFSIILYSFILTTFFSSIFRYNTNILAMLLIYINSKTIRFNLNRR